MMQINMSRGKNKLNADNFKVNLSLKDTISKLDNGIASLSITGERIEQFLYNGIKIIY